MSNENHSPFFLEAKKLLREASSTSYSLEEKIEKATLLASYILKEASRMQDAKEKARYAEIARMVQDPLGKAFTTVLTDQCFRSNNPIRVADQMLYLLDLYGIPKFLSFSKRFFLFLFRNFADKFPKILVPLAKHYLRKETSSVMIPGEEELLHKHLIKRKEEQVRLNINHLGEAILGEEEARARLEIYLEDLRGNEIDYISVKISTIYSQIQLHAPEETLQILAKRLRTLYRTAIEHPYVDATGKMQAKFVNLDMEEYKDLHLTTDLFIQVLSEEEFLTYSAGIVLQAYLPDAFEIQKKLTDFAQKRKQKGGTPIKIRLVKGANLAMEQVEASLKEWPQAPYLQKHETDANYKKMLTFGCQKEHAQAAHIGVASHNLFDLSFALILREEQKVHHEVQFEMLEGMADHMRKVIQHLTGSMLLYCPVAKKKDFSNAIAYLIRRLDENTGAENFLRHSFAMQPKSKEWENQKERFFQSCISMDQAEIKPRRQQDRNTPPHHLEKNAPFYNEPDTDFSLPQNQKWLQEILIKQKNTKIPSIPLVIGGEEIHHPHPEGKGFDPSAIDTPLYTYSQATQEEVEKALVCAKEAESKWANESIEKRCEALCNIAKLLRQKRDILIGAAIADGSKTPQEADIEVSEAIDFCEYYLRMMQKLGALHDLSWSPKGTILVTPPWNFPIAIPLGGSVASLVCGNCTLLKPAKETVYIAWELAKIIWEAGVPKEIFQFINCVDDPIGSQLIRDPRIHCVILTGATETAKLFMHLRPGIDLAAETGGKNAMIITAMADRDTAIRDLIHSAFGHNGQKCSAASIAILEKELYEDPDFLRQLKDAASSLTTGTAWELSSKLTPLIRAPEKDLQRALTSLEEGEEWLLQPKEDPKTPHLWSPGIKLGVKKGSYTHQTEFFGPVLGLMRAENFHHAIEIANSTPYGLTAGLQSLDEREHKIWQEKMIAGNLYINRGITGAIVQRQSFGGCKNSSFGHGSKAGGPNYLIQFMQKKQTGLPKERFPVNQWVNHLSRLFERIDLSAEELGLWYASIGSYAFWWKKFQKKEDKSKRIGEDNLFTLRPRAKMWFRIRPEDRPLDYLRVFAAALTCHIKLHVSWERPHKKLFPQVNWMSYLPIFNLEEETEEHFLHRIQKGEIRRARLLSPPNEMLKEAAALSSCYLNWDPVVANGRIELLHYLREVAISIAYHRYGNLGIREGELRSPIS